MNFVLVDLDQIACFGKFLLTQGIDDIRYPIIPFPFPSNIHSQERFSRK